MRFNLPFGIVAGILLTLAVAAVAQPPPPPRGWPPPGMPPPEGMPPPPPPPPPGMPPSRAPMYRVRPPPWQPPPAPPPSAPATVDMQVPDSPAAPSSAAPAASPQSANATVSPDVEARAPVDDDDPAAEVTPGPDDTRTPQAKAAAPAAPMRSRGTPPRSYVWLLPILAGVLLALWASLRRGRTLAFQTAHLSRQQRALTFAHRQLKEKSQRLRELSTQDPLTGVLNRLAFGTELRERLDHLERYNQPLSLIMFDLDHFKDINDRFGHTLGDRALQLVVGIVHEHLDSDDLFGRFGGDEFMIACAGQPLATVTAMAEAIRMAIAERIPTEEPMLQGIGLSMGLAQANPENGYAADALFERADAALYQAKQRGRNRVVTAEAGIETAPGVVLRHL